jgi:phytoene dehydrogenase-like protein
MPTSDYDAIIIGSGLGGLSCAACLAMNGKRVVVLEKHNVPGGYASGFRRGAYLFDTGLHMIPGVGKGQNMAKFYEWCGVADNIDFIRIKNMLRMVFPDHDIQFPSGNLQGVMEVAEKNFPEEKEGIQKLFRQMVKIHQDTMKFFFSTGPMWRQLLIFPFRYKSLFSAMKKPVKELLDKYLKNEKLKTLLFANWGYYGLPPSKLSVLGIAPNISFWMEGGYYPKGGNQVVPNAFVDVIKQNHGEIVFNSEVSSIIVKDRKAIGVVTKAGQRYLGENIISNASAIDTFRNLVGEKELTAKFVTKMNAMEPSTSSFNVILGLDENFKSALNNENDYDIIVSDTYNLDQDYEWTQNCEAEKASFFITLYSNVDKTLAKGTRFVISILQKQNFDHWKPFETDYNAGRKEEYNKEKDRIASVLIKRAEKIIPNLSKYIDAIEIETPLTMKRYTGNFNGAIYGWANTVKQFTPMDRITNIPIKNLYLSSAWTFPGEGQATTVACGYRLANKLIRKQRRDGYHAKS